MLPTTKIVSQAQFLSIPGLIMEWEEFEDTKGVIRNCKSMKNRQHSGHKKTDKRTNNHLQNITYKTKDWVTRHPTNMTNEKKKTLMKS